MIFYSLYYFPFSQPSFHPYFFFPPHVILSYPYLPSFILSLSPLFFIFFLIQHNSHSLSFLSSALSLFFFFLLDSSALILSFFFSSALSLFFCFYLTPALSFFLFFFSSALSLFFFFLLDSSAFILSFFFSSALSLSLFFFFYLIPEWGIKVRVLWEHFLSRLFLPIWEDEICGPGRENFLPSFPPFLFSSACQIVENTVLLSIFLSMFSISPKFTTTKHSVRD